MVPLVTVQLQREQKNVVFGDILNTMYRYIHLSRSRCFTGFYLFIL